MRHEKILKRQDGSRVRIVAELHIGYTDSKPRWSFYAMTCEPGKRTWRSACDTDSYSYRNLDMAERLLAVRDAALSVATKDEIESAMLELWEIVKPSVGE